MENNMPLFYQPPAQRNQSSTKRSLVGLKSARIFTLAASVTLGLGSYPAHAQSAATPNNDIGLQELTTPKGNKFWHYPLPDSDRTAMVVTWAQQIPADGTVHPSVARIAVNTMLNGGAAGREAADIGAAFQDLDAGSDLWVELDSVTGFIVAPNEHFAAANEIGAQVTSEPTLAQRWFDREHQAFVESAVEDQSNSWEIAWNLVGEVLIGDHPYHDFFSNSPIESLKAVTLADAKKWHQSSFNKNTSTISVAGSADVDAIAKEIDLFFKNHPDKTPAEPVALKKPEVQGKTILLHQPDAPKSLLIIVGELPSDSEATNLPLQLGLGVLGGGQQSRLFKSVRSTLGASYGFSAGTFDITREHKFLRMEGEIETQQLQDVLDEVEKTYIDFRDDGVGLVEFPLAKRVYKREFKKALQNPVGIAYEVIGAMQDGFSPDFLWNFEDRIDELSRAGTNKQIKASFPAYENLLKVILSPDDKAIEGACVITKIEDVTNCL